MGGSDRHKSSNVLFGALRRLAACHPVENAFVTGLGTPLHARGIGIDNDGSGGPPPVVMIAGGAHASPFSPSGGWGTRYRAAGHTRWPHGVGAHARHLRHAADSGAGRPMVGMAGVVPGITGREGWRAGPHGHLPLQGSLVHRPHLHGDAPVGFDDFFPYSRENDLAIGPDQVVMALLHMGSDDIDMKECLFDELFHSLFFIFMCQLQAVRYSDEI